MNLKFYIGGELDKLITIDYNAIDCSTGGVTTQTYVHMYVPIGTCSIVWQTDIDKSTFGHNLVKSKLTRLMHLQRSTLLVFFVK